MVSSKGTSSLITDVFSRLAAGGAPADALAGAEQKMMQDPKFSHPYFWAAFALVGGVDK